MFHILIFYVIELSHTSLLINFTLLYFAGQPVLKSLVKGIISMGPLGGLHSVKVINGFSRGHPRKKQE